ncbi:MAG: lysophospholipid acyltransferase family protein [Gammaproteobacteria bacterium]|nr:lysophospholipid acyltransferase family protein [Gammaproteobacteria bacterium]
MRLRLVKFLLRLLSHLPLPLTQAAGAALGWLAWHLPTSPGRVSRVNVALCFPELSPAEQTALARRSLIETGKALTELGWIWFKPHARLIGLIQGVQGQEHLDAARENSRGLIIISPHLGSWEFCTVPLALEKRPLFMYRSPRQASLEPLIVESRTRFGAELAALDAAGIKSVLRGLRGGRTVGILPDQEPDLNNGVFAPLFGVDANTMTLLSRFAAREEVGLVMMYCERLRAGRGYIVHYLPADPAIRSADKALATEALNRSLERCIRQCAEQYIWSYKRFRQRPDGSRRPYQ